MDAGEIIDRLGLEPHPEGGHYRETWRHDPGDRSRGAGTAILFLLQAGERSHWHRVDADELWFFHLGDPLRLTIEQEPLLLGADLGAGQHLQAHVPAGAWQSAEPTGAFTLVSCTVSPAFEFTGFQLAPTPLHATLTLRSPPFWVSPVVTSHKRQDPERKARRSGYSGL